MRNSLGETKPIRIMKDQTLTPMRKLHLFTGLGILFLAASPLVVPLFSPWSGINSRLEEIDVTSGRARETRYLFWIPVQQEVWETPLSRVLSGVPPAAGEAR